MRISCDYNKNHNNTTFEALKIKPSKKLSKRDLATLLDNKELQKLASTAEKKGVDIQAEYYCASMYDDERGFICLKNSYDYTLGYFNLSFFEYDFFKASDYLYQIEQKPKNPIHKFKTIKEYAKITLDKLKHLYKN
jgi:hypothetical protein